MVRKGFLLEDLGEGRWPVEDVLVVGRTQECDIPLDDSSVSRRHLEVRLRGGQFYWRDLGSTNGTLVNESPMLEGVLHAGDRIQVGETVLRFEVEEGGDLAEEGGDPRRFKDAILDLSGSMRNGGVPEKSSTLLEAIYTVMHEIATNYDPCLLLDRILMATLEAINAQRGAIFLATDEAVLAPCPECGKVHRIRDGKIAPVQLGDIHISSTVAQRVLREGESVLYQDTDCDSELNASESILSLALRSIICVPLRAKHGILGILYIDSDRQSQLYSHEDMLLAAAVGNSAGLALENARMHQEILVKQRIEQEIETAWTIQEGFLVKSWPENESTFQVYGETRPAKTVGGDFYDFVRPDEHTVGILIGDVSGKGVPAALTMAQLLAEFRLLARDHTSPADVLQALNMDLVRRSRRGMFCTLCYLVLDLRTGEMKCANAGHPAAVCIEEDAVTTFAAASGPPAGILPEACWREESRMVAPGASILLYTDGIVEARSVATRHSGKGEELVEYGEEGLMTVAGAQFSRAPQHLVDAINTDVRRFCAPSMPHDDCTMIAVRFLDHAQ